MKNSDELTVDGITYKIEERDGQTNIYITEGDTITYITLIAFSDKRGVVSQTEKNKVITKKTPCALLEITLGSEVLVWERDKP